MDTQIGDILEASWFNGNYDLIDNSQDIESLVSHLSLDQDEYDVQAAFVMATEGEYDEIWISESGNYFMNWAKFERVK